MSKESVNHPEHYQKPGIPECIDIIEALGWTKGFCLGNALKYIYRAEDKGNELEDLKKARWYLDRYIQNQDYPVDSPTEADKLLTKAADALYWVTWLFEEDHRKGLIGWLQGKNDWGDPQECLDRVKAAYDAIITRRYSGIDIPHRSNVEKAASDPKICPVCSVGVVNLSTGACSSCEFKMSSLPREMVPQPDDPREFHLLDTAMTFHRREIVESAAKQHTCCECAGAILKGTRYEKFTGKHSNEDRVKSYATCLDCVETREQKCPNAYPGYLGFGMRKESDNGQE